MVAATRSAIYLSTGDAAAPALSVITADAVQVPNAVVIPATAVESPFAALGPGTAATLGAGELRLGTFHVLAGSTWTPPRPNLPDAGVALRRTDELWHLIDTMAVPALEALHSPVSRLRRGVQTRDAAAVETAAHRLVGLGPGLTPSGDDIICGVLASCHALAATDAGSVPIRAALATAIDNAFVRTSFVSAVLMRHAARGEVIPQVVGLLEALAAGADLRAPLAALLAVGHHSGSDLARGMAIGLEDGHSRPAR